MFDKAIRKYHVMTLNRLYRKHWKLLKRLENGEEKVRADVWKATADIGEKEDRLRTI